MREIVFVTEDTGVRPNGRNYVLVEIGALELSDGILTGRSFHSYINPRAEISADAMNKHQLSPEFLQDFPVFSDVAEPLLEFIGPSSLVVMDSVHENNRVNNDLLRAGVKLLQSSRFVDVSTLARHFNPDRKFNLHRLANELQVPYPSGYGALFNCELLAEIYTRLCKRKNSSSVVPIKDESGLTKQLSAKIFIVHGRDGEAREAVARFLDRQKLTPIVLHEKSNQGSTFIEKFERESEVGFIIVLLTPDDFGGLVGQQSKRRARQNVILELGCFIGRLGRKYVCVLKKGDLEIPSDILGITWGTLDNGGGWKFEVARDLRAAGYSIDLNVE